MTSRTKQNTHSIIGCVGAYTKYTHNARNVVLDNNFEAWDMSRHLGRLDRDQMAQLFYRSRGCHIQDVPGQVCNILKYLQYAKNIEQNY